VVATVSGYVDGFKYAGVYADGSEYELRITTDYVSGKNTVVLLPVREEGDEKTFDAADLIASDKLKLGQSIINIGGDKDTSIQVGRIASLLKEKTEDDVEYITSIITDISSATPGSVITNFSGAIVGYNAYVNDLKQQKSFITVGELVAKKAGESEEPPTNNNP